MRMKLSKRQWESIGKTAGWIKKESGIKDKIYEYLSNSPLFHKANDIVKQIENKTISLKDFIKNVGIRRTSCRSS